MKWSTTIRAKFPFLETRVGLFIFICDRTKMMPTIATFVAIYTANTIFQLNVASGVSTLNTLHS
jgi:hypothetical protein